MKIDLTNFVSGALHTAVGMLQGQMAGQQLAQQQQEAQLNQQLNLAKLMQSGQEQQDANTRAGLQYLEPDSVAGALGTLANRPSPYAGLRQSRLVQQRPDLQAMFPPQPAPQGAGGGMFGAMAGQRVPAAAQQPLGPREFRGQGGVVQRTKGVSKEQMAARGRTATEALKALEDYAPAATSPVEQADIADLIQKIRGADSSTVEGYQALGEHLARAGRYAGLGRQAAQTAREGKFKTDVEAYDAWRKGEHDLNDEQWFGSLPGALGAEKSIGDYLTGQKRGNPHVYLQGHEKDITDIQSLRESAKTSTDPEFAAEMSAAADMSQKTLRARMTSKLSPRDEATKEKTVRDRLDSMNPLRITSELVRKMYDDAGIGYLVKDLPNKAIRFGDATLYKRLAQAKGQLAQWVNINPAGQKLLLDEIGELQKKLKIDIEVPQEIKAQMTPAQLAEDEKRKADSARADRAETRAEIKLLMDWDKAQRDKQIAAGKLTPKEQKALEAVDKNLAAARAHLEKVATNERIRPSQITDFDHPADPRETKYVAAHRAYEAAVEARKQKLRELGVKVPDVQPMPTAPFQAPPAPPKTERKTILGIPYGPEVPVETPGQTPQGAGAAPTSRQVQDFSSRGQHAAKEALRTKTAPVPAATLGLVKSHMGAGWLGWVGTLSPANQEKAWAAYWYSQYSQPGRKASGSSSTPAKR